MFVTHSLELDLIGALQGEGTLKKLMEQPGYLGSEAFGYVLPFVYFCLSRKAGAQLYLIFSLSGSLLHIFKLTFHLPRPYWLDGRIKAMSGAGNYGLPSGHALAATVGWGFIAKTLSKLWVWLLALTFIFLASLSRVYLGAHFISDVVAAWGIGVGILWCFDRIKQRLADWLNTFTFSWQITFALWATAFIVAAGLALKFAIAGITDDPSWSRYSVHARKLEGLYFSTGEFFGACCGVIMAGRWACFEAKGPLWKRGLAAGYALLGAWVIKQLVGLIPPLDGEAIQSSVNFVRGAVSTWWILLSPSWLRCFCRPLARRKTRPNLLSV